MVKLKRTTWTAILCILCTSCSSSRVIPRDVDEVVSVSRNAALAVTRDIAKDVLDEYTTFFEIPNTLFGSSERVSRRQDPMHRESIWCSVILLDDRSTEADILESCVKDSLDDDACAVFRKKYVSDYLRDGMFRIRIDMESGFSEKSMDPDFWDMYIVTASDVTLEPDDIVASEVHSMADSVKIENFGAHMMRNMFKRRVTLYFKKTTFYGKDLFGKDNPYIVFVMSREQDPVARIGWDLTGVSPKKHKLPPDRSK